MMWPGSAARPTGQNFRNLAGQNFWNPHVSSLKARELKAFLTARDSLVVARTQLVNRIQPVRHERGYSNDDRASMPTRRDRAPLPRAVLRKSVLDTPATSYSPNARSSSRQLTHARHCVTRLRQLTALGTRRGDCAARLVVNRRAVVAPPSPHSGCETCRSSGGAGGSGHMR